MANDTSDAPHAQVSDDGGDVAGRDPDEIAREIEQTRAELADTIDAIADRISPKRAASRGAQAVKAQVTGARSKAEEVVAAVEGSGPEPSALPSVSLSSASPQPSLPVVPIAVAAGFLVVVVLFIRRRRSR